jgi:hypothetical protein
MERALGARVEVADDDVWREAGFEERVGTTVDGDQHRVVLAEIRPEHLEVVLVVVTAHDDECMAPQDLNMELRQHERLEGEVGFLVDILEGVAREIAQFGLIFRT